VDRGGGQACGQAGGGRVGVQHGGDRGDGAVLAEREPGGGGQPRRLVPGRLGVVEPRGQLGDRPGGLAEGAGGPFQAEPRRLVVDQECLAGRPPPGAGHDHEGDGPAELVADAAQRLGGGAERPRAGAERGRLPGGPAHRLGPDGRAGVGRAGPRRAATAGIRGIGGSWGRGNGGTRF